MAITTASGILTTKRCQAWCSSFPKCASWISFFPSFTCHLQWVSLGFLIWNQNEKRCFGSLLTARPRHKTHPSFNEVQMPRIAVFSDVHGNSIAFQRFLKSAELDDADAFICLGDLIGYIPNPSILQTVLGSLPGNTVYLQGNHEHMVVNQQWPTDDSILSHRKC